MVLGPGRLTMYFGHKMSYRVPSVPYVICHVNDITAMFESCKAGLDLVFFAVKALVGGVHV